MDTLQFFRRIMPARGIYVIDTPAPNGKGFRHLICHTHEQMVERSLALDAQGSTVYHACSAFEQESVERRSNKTQGETYDAVRVQENVRAIKSFWLDLDVGEGLRKYPSQAAAISGLGAFLRECGLPAPILVSSGYGVHAYWPLASDVIPAKWIPVARQLKSLAAKLGLHADPSRTSDTASVLRPVGTHNRKNNAVAPVVAGADVPDVEFSDFAGCIRRACDTHGVSVKEDRAKAAELNAKYQIQADHVKSWSEPIALACQQVRDMKDSSGNVSEPHWYAVLEVLHFTEDGERFAHEWSRGHPNYSAEETSDKLDQIDTAGVKPTTCAHFEVINPKSCEGCPFKGKVHSPISLGQKVERAAAQTIKRAEDEFTLPDPPPPYVRGAAGTGLWIEVEQGLPLVQFHKRDLYPFDIFFDERAGQEQVALRYDKPHEGVIDVVINTEDLHDPKLLLKDLMNSGVHASPGFQAKSMAGYMDAYIQTLRESAKTRKLYDSQGWKEEGFLLGEIMHTPTGPVKAGTSARVKDMFRGLSTKGDLQAWADQTSVLAEPGYEQMAFVMALGFGAPLFQFTGHGGVLVNLYSPQTGLGKTTSAAWMMSIYGSFTDMRMSANSTINARIERLGAYKHLPYVIDEITKIKRDDVAPLAYMISEGEGRGRLQRDATMVQAAKWNTFVVSTSNESLIAKLTAASANTSAQASRIYEYIFAPHADMKVHAKQVNRFITENYGLAGPVYIAELVRMRGQLPGLIRQSIDWLEKELGADESERFWTGAVACSLIGAKIAHRLGLIQFDPMALLPWLRSQRSSMVEEMVESSMTAKDLLSEFVHEYVHAHVVVRIDGTEGQKVTIPVNEGRGMSVAIRSAGKAMWIDRKVIRQWLEKQCADYASVKRELAKQGILMGVDVRKVLTSGVRGMSNDGLQVPCWKINLAKAKLEEVEDADA